MRIACIHIPQFALQSASRLDPALRGAPVVVVGGHEPGRERSGPLHTPVVMACSRAAWAVGVRLGITAAAARARSPELRIVTADPGLERETVRAIGDAALGICEVVDLGGRVGAGGAHLAMYCGVPVKTRGATFGDRLLAMLEDLGLTGRIGIADDRFTAWVAAAHGSADEHGVTSVPRGGSAAFLASRPLSLLAIPSEVQHMLEALGVRTLGEFAALPAPSVHRPVEADYQALARGEGGTALRGYVPEAPVREEIVVGGNVLDRADAVSGPTAIAMIARRLELRLAGRARHAARLDVVATPLAAASSAFAPASAFGSVTDPREPREVSVTLDAPTGDAEELARMLAPVLDPSRDAAAAHGSSREAAAHGASRDAAAHRSSRDAAAHGSSREAAAHDLSRDAAAHGSSRDAAAHDSSRDAVAGVPVWRLRVVVAAETVPGAETIEIAAEGSAPFMDRPIADSGATIHPLAVVLSTPGSLFALSSPDLRAERRDAHRRTRRGKQRRGRPTPLSQARLFDRRS